MPEKFVQSSMNLVYLEKNIFGFDEGFIEFVRDNDEAISGFNVFTINCYRGMGSKFIGIAY